MSDNETAELRSPRAGSAVSIDRRYAVLESITVPAVADIATATEIDMREYAGGTILFRASETMVTLTFYAGEQPSGTFEQLYDTVNAAVSMTVAADRAYPLPDECYGAHILKLIGNVAATQAVDVCLKG